jgi:hypothetical protein
MLFLFSLEGWESGNESDIWGLGQAWFPLFPFIKMAILEQIKG